MKRNFKDPFPPSEYTEKRTKLNVPYFSSNKFNEPHQSYFDNKPRRNLTGQIFNNYFSTNNFDRFQRPNGYNFNQPRFANIRPFFSNNQTDTKYNSFGIELKRKISNEINLVKNKISNLDNKERLYSYNKKDKSSTNKDKGNRSFDSVFSNEQDNTELISLNSNSSCELICDESYSSNDKLDEYEDACCDSNFIIMITHEITNYCCKYAQTNESLSNKCLFKKYLEKILNNPLYIVGSTLNGLGLITSDIDLCYRNNSVTENDSRKQSKQCAINALYRIRNKLKISNVYNVQLIQARVPILKFQDRKFNFECDLNINNLIGVRNSYLLKAYVSVDVRLKFLVLFVKYWARLHSINDASCGTLSSYSISLMAIHFLQYGCSPPVLPNLQNLYPEYFDPNRNVDSLAYDNIEFDFKSKKKKVPTATLR